MFVAATWMGLVPWWLTAIAVARDVLIGLGAVVFTLWFGPLRGRPTIISKVNTAVQLGYLVAAIVAAASGFPPREVLAALAWLTLATTVISGIDYVTKFTRRAWQAPAAVP